ncbi:hypothetical protein M2282_006038 [Variovorax boronicumulans]|uniref:hypothetical protein n=1 Tax=Variovorax boronicumulans TaxID=436515 RepID=UPI002475C06A|nr:hypothetical protein [Variovorax boronicumulans]MDH6170858.1 hypothetical protein [Variovorax boronicumulans]
MQERDNVIEGEMKFLRKCAHELAALLSAQIPVGERAGSVCGVSPDSTKRIPETTVSLREIASDVVRPNRRALRTSKKMAHPHHPSPRDIHEWEIELSVIVNDARAFVGIARVSRFGQEPRSLVCEPQPSREAAILKASLKASMFISLWEA